MSELLYKGRSLNTTPEDVFSQLQAVELKVLGYNVPDNMPVKNEIRGDKFIQKVHRKPLTICTWVRTETATANKYRFRSSIEFTGAVMPIDSTHVGNIGSNDYPTVTNENTYNGVEGISLHYNNKRVHIYDESLCTATSAEFLAAMKGKFIYYELEEPIEYPVEQNIQNTGEYGSKTVTEADDLNDLLLPGRYEIPSSSFAKTELNYPVDGYGGYMNVIVGNKVDGKTHIAIQEYVGFTGTSKTLFRCTRHYYNGTWYRWNGSDLITIADVAAGSTSLSIPLETLKKYRELYLCLYFDGMAMADIYTLAGYGSTSTDNTMQFTRSWSGLVSSKMTIDVDTITIKYNSSDNWQTAALGRNGYRLTSGSATMTTLSSSVPRFYIMGRMS